jgi:hypothetical protein
MTNEGQQSGLSPEQIQLAIRLESIFMPHARRQREAAYKQQGKSFDISGKDQLRFAHYTSADAALRIIESKRLWMRNTTCMADYREVQHGFEILNKFFSDKAKSTAFSAALDVCTPGVAQEAINIFNQWWANIRFDTYIASISEHDDREDLHGRLSMWRAFGGNTARVAIVVSIPKYSGAAISMNLLFSPVAYLREDEVYEVINEIIENVGENYEFLSTVDRQIILGTVFNMLLASVTCLKHEGFREEREWRAIYSPKRLPSTLMEFATEVIGGVPQFVYKVPLDATVAPVLAGLDFATMFDRLIIGPSPYPWPMYEAFTAALAKSGVANAGKRVFVSGIPIRS